MILNLSIYILSFVLIWIGSGLAVSSVEKLAKMLKTSSFLVSFIVLGLFTSIGEISVGINSILKNDPEIYVGNIIGATIVLFMLIIPLLAITGKRIKISAEFQGFNLPASLVTIGIPVFLSFDGKIDRIDSIIAVIVYLFLVLSLQVKKSFFEKLKSMARRSGVQTGKELIRILFGVTIIFFASKFVVDQTLYFSEFLNISPFIISLLVISLGTNVPELSLVFRSIFMKNNQVAFGNYVGSASFNTFLIGILTLINGETVFLNNSYVVSLSFLVVGLVGFYFFARTKNTVTRLEGLTLLGLYIVFISAEILM